MILELSEMRGISPEEENNKNVNAVDEHLSFKLFVMHSKFQQRLIQEHTAIKL